MRWVWHVACIREMKNAYNCLIRKPDGTDHLDHQDGTIILEGILGKQWEGVDWIHLAQDRDQWWAVVNVVINLHIP
jgi:hypothetical protein